MPALWDDPVNKAARTIRQATLRTIAKNLGNSYLGLHLTGPQLRAAARTAYDRARAKIYPSRFFGENNAINTPR